MTRETRWPFVSQLLGMVLFAAGAADGHHLVISARDADWALLLRADLELLGGLWLLSGRFAVAAGITVLGVFGGLLIFDVTRMAAGYAPREGFGRVAIGPVWVVIGELLILAGVLGWRASLKDTARFASHPGRIAMALLIAAAVGLAIDRTQFGQFPIVATARAGRSSSGLDYLVYLPNGYYRSLGRWPLILTLHGRGESGNDLDLVRRQGLSLRVEEQGALPFVIVAPQSPGWAWNVETLNALLDEVLKKYRIDADRVYLVGNSMGGTGTWAMATHDPQRFAAIAPICGGGDPGSARRLTDVPTWAFHGSEDRVVPLEQSKRMIAALKQAGGDARLTIYPGVGHDAWTRTYANPEFYAWLLHHRRGMGLSRISPHVIQHSR